MPLLRRFVNSRFSCLLKNKNRLVDSNRLLLLKILLMKRIIVSAQLNCDKSVTHNHFKNVSVIWKNSKSMIKTMKTCWNSKEINWSRILYCTKEHNAYIKMLASATFIFRFYVCIIFAANGNHAKISINNLIPGVTF